MTTSGDQPHIPPDESAEEQSESGASEESSNGTTGPAPAGPSSRGPLGFLMAHKLAVIIAGSAIVAVIVVVVIILSVGLVGGGGGAGSSDAQAFILDEANSTVWIIPVGQVLAAPEVPALFEAPWLNAPRVTSYDDPEDWKEDWMDREWSSSLPVPYRVMEEIALEDLSAVVIQDYSGAQGFALIGDFPFDDLRDAMDDEGWDDDSYRDFEVWGDRRVALLEDDGVILVGNTYVADVLKAIDNQRGIIDGDSVAKRVLDKVGPGLSVVVITGACNSYGNPSLRGCDGFGFAYTGGNVDVSLVSAAYLFSSSSRAESGMDDIEDGILDSREVDADIVDLGVSGDFVTFELEVHE